MYDRLLHGFCIDNIYKKGSVYQSMKHMQISFPGPSNSCLYDTGIPGPSVLLCCCNHGNEIMGLEIIKKIFGDQALLSSLSKGKIAGLLLNPKAYQQNKRLIDANLNRIWNVEGEGYEFTRRDEIKQFLQEHLFDYCIDLHTTSKPYGAVGICDTNHLEIGQQIYDTDMIWVDDLLKQGSFAGYFNSLGGIALGLEAGQHTDLAAIDAGIDTVMQLLYYADMLESCPSKKRHGQVSYAFAKELFCKTDAFTYAQEFTGLQKVAKGEIIGYDHQEKVINDLEGDIYFGLATNLPVAGDGIGFLFRKLA